MAGVVMTGSRAIARYAGPIVKQGARVAGTALGYWALDEATQAVSAWLDRQSWQGGERHRGLDLPAPVGTPVLAPTDCVVIGKQTTERGGNELFLAGPRMARADATDPNRWPRPEVWFARGDVETGRDELGVDDSGWRFGMSHLSGTNVEVKSIVRRGQQVATTGNTGKSSGPHLHLTTFWVQDGLRDVHVFVDPALLIPGLPRSVPTSQIGPGAYVTVCILTRVSTKEQAMSKLVVQQLPTGIGVNWAATVGGI